MISIRPVHNCWFALLFAAALVPPVAAEESTNWHQWRGPLATGVSETADPPVDWSEERHVQWKVAVAGEGGSTPIVWDDKIFLLTAIDTEQVDPELPAPADQPERPFGITYPNTVYDRVVLCLDRATGEEVWRRTATSTVPVEGHHRDNDFASSSPVTDGQYVYAWFGSAGMFCFDVQGKPVWNRQLGEAKTRLSFGEASSPVLHQGKLVITRDQEDQSYLYVLDAMTGDVLWSVPRDEPSCWATPIIVEANGTTQLITNGHNRARSYDLADGRLIWSCGGQVSNVIPSPVQYQGSVICMSGYRGAAAVSIPLTAAGDVTDSSEIRWTRDKHTPYVPSPLLYGDQLYFTASNEAILSAVDAASGEVLIETTRLSKLRGMYASPVGAAGRVYLVGRNGVTLVIRHGADFEVLATNTLEERFDASPAVAGSQLFLRGEKFLYALSAEE